MNNIQNPCIASIFMGNINPKTVQRQKEVVAKFNKTKIPHYQVLTEVNPGFTMDKLVDMLENKGHDAIMFLDIDCVPLNENSLSYMFDLVDQGKIAGDAQRSNHIENAQHVFCAPHNVTFGLKMYRELKNPSFMPNARGDVAEELTFVAEENNIPVEILMPIKFDAPPIRMAWETDATPHWNLADGMPVYGIGTTFGKDNVEMFWHNYQIFHPGQQERFWKKCEELLNG